jgi:nicotinamide-nucleotide amidase
MTASDATVSTELDALASVVAQELRRRGAWLATAESCTGGLIAAACTRLAGASAWFERGLITYSNASKSELLGVPLALIQQHGAVSQPVAEAMAVSLCQRAPVQYGLAVTGIAGPDGGTPSKPVGTVWLAWATAVAVRSECLHLAGSRAAIQQQAAAAALQGLLQRLG